jgi:hypothetical protein
MNDIDRLIPFRQAIAMAGMRPTKAYQQVTVGRLKVVRNGRRTFVKASELQRFISALEG